MEVKLAKSAGFCYGVERAVNAVYNEIRKNSESSSKTTAEGASDDKTGKCRRHRKIYTYGPIVHNDIVVNELAANGVGVIEGIEELKAMAENGKLKDATVIIRAHGVGRDVTDILDSLGDETQVVDATCPFVKKIHKTVTEHHSLGEQIIVTGTASHPEVMGILGQIDQDAAVIENVQDAENFSGDSDKIYCLVSQTTFNVQKFKDIVAILQKKLYHVNVVDTICNATQLRQKEALEMSRECDAVIVIGGRHSSNASKLFDICSKECSMTYFIESLQDFTEKKLDSSVRCVGITAGASTPKTIIQEVLNYVRDEF